MIDLRYRLKYTIYNIVWLIMCKSNKELNKYKTLVLILTSCKGSLPSLLLLTSTGQSEMLRAREALPIREVCLLLFRVQMLKINNLWWKLRNPHF